jgi:hypothetical protein
MAIPPAWTRKTDANHPRRATGGRISGSGLVIDGFLGTTSDAGESAEDKPIQGITTPRGGSGPRHRPQAPRSAVKGWTIAQDASKKKGLGPKRQVLDSTAKSLVGGTGIEPVTPAV